MPDRFDGDLELDDRAFRKMRPFEDGQRDQLLQHRRPRRRGRLADLASAEVYRDRQTRRRRGDGRWKARRVIQFLDLRPLDFEAGDLPGLASRVLLAKRALPDE